MTSVVAKNKLIWWRAILSSSIDRDKDGAAVEGWAKKVYEVALKYGWSDVDIIRLVALGLRGHTRTLYDAVEHLNGTWDDIKDLTIFAT